MILLKSVNCWSSSIGLLPKLLKLHHKSKIIKDLWFPNNLKSCSYCSCVGMKTEKTEHFTTENYATPDILKSSKVPKIRLSHEVIDMLCEIFETDDEKFKKALLRQKHLGNCSETHLRNTSLYLRELNITEDHIIFAPGILLLKKADIEAKTPLIEESYLFKNIRDGLGFAFLHPELISAFNKQFEREDELFDPYRNRIYYIGGKLNIPIDFLTLKIVTENKILSLEKKTLDMYIDLLVEAKCRPMAILNYFKIFYFNYNILKKRLNEVGQLKGSPAPTLWWCFTTEEVYKRFYLRAKKYEYCYEDDILELVKEELELNEEEALDFISRGNMEKLNPKILQYKIRKYKEEGFSSGAFLVYPAVLGYSEERILGRIRRLKEKGLFQYANFSKLGLQDNVFNEYVKFLQVLKENYERSNS